MFQGWQVKLKILAASAAILHNKGLWLAERLLKKERTEAGFSCRSLFPADAVSGQQTFRATARR
jgi:hypothetical protein